MVNVPLGEGYYSRAKYRIVDGTHAFHCTVAFDNNRYLPSHKKLASNNNALTSP